MTVLPIILLCAVVLWVAYMTYGRLLVRWLGTDAYRPTPAVEKQDGVDYCPAPAPVVLGGHFTAIAAAGPIVGPILAGLLFGWVPALIWIVLGAIFIGSIHDAGSLFASVRHHARSITQVVREHISRRAYLTFLCFVWLSLIYVIIAFADVTAGTFSRLEQITSDVSASPITINGGAVAVGASAYLLVSIVMGLLIRYARIPWFILLAPAVISLGITITYAPQIASFLTGLGLGVFDASLWQTATLAKRWDLILLGYCFIASIVPLWLLLQPRGVIGATFLYATLFFGIVGALIGGVSGAPSLAINWDRAFTGWVSESGLTLFPFLFITIACGACSGFHSIVGSGTTSKQLKSERDIKPVAIGGMLLESMVAVLALSCVMVLATGVKTGSPDLVFAQGMANFQSMLGIPMTFALGFGLLAFSSFVFDTLDVCTRLGRYVFQELTGLSGRVGGVIATLCTLLGPAVYLMMAPPEWGFRTFWTIFGTSNQLLAALTLVGVSVWLWRSGRPVWYALLPAAFMLISTATALVMNVIAFTGQYQKAIGAGTSGAPMAVNIGVAIILMILGTFVVIEAARVWTLSRLARSGR